MQSIDEIKNWLKENLSEVRFQHTIGVAETARLLGKKWGVDEDRAFLAGLIHDCAKEVLRSDAIALLKESGYNPDDVELLAPALLHAPLGRVFAKNIFGIQDEEVLMAVRYHTTGRAGMSLLEKIIYVADFVEPNRKISEADELRSLAYENLDMAALKAADISILYTIKKGGALHTDTVLARNYFLKKTKEGKINET